MKLQSIRQVSTFVLVVVLLNSQPTHSQADTAQQAYELDKRAHEYIEKKQYKAALEVLKRSLQLKEDPWVYRNIGHCYVKLNDNQSARRNFEQAFSMEPNNIANRDWLCYCYNQQKDYEATIAICKPVMAKHITDKTCTQLWYHYAHALAQVRRYADAYTAWDHYFDLSPSDPNDWWQACDDFRDPAAAQYLYPLHQEYAKRFPNHKGVEAMAGQVRTSIQTARSAASAAKQDKFDTLITYKDPNKPNVVSRTFYGMVKEGLRSIPEHVWKPLIDYGCKVMLTPYITDVDPENRNKHPRGYKIGATYYSVPGCYMEDKKWMTIAEYHLDDNNKPTKNSDPAATVCHELGHAYDNYLGACSRILQAEEIYDDFSHSKAFTEAYVKDASTLSPAAKKDLSYFLQTEDRAGQEELFAELFPILFDEAAIQGSKDELLRQEFPTTLKLMASVLRVHWEKK